jgi:hypothetical protein
MHMETQHVPTPEQFALYARLKRTYGDTPEWQVTTRGRDFPQMTRHRAAHHLQRLLIELTSQHLIVPCGCAGRLVPGFQTPKQPAMEGPAARDGRSS